MMRQRPSSYSIFRKGRLNQPPSQVSFVCFADFFNALIGPPAVYTLGALLINGFLFVAERRDNSTGSSEIEGCNVPRFI
jgi:hypothetical protein